jgi:hypothetical protein
MLLDLAIPQRCLRVRSSWRQHPPPSPEPKPLPTARFHASTAPVSFGRATPESPANLQTAGSLSLHKRAPQLDRLRNCVYISKTENRGGK